MCESRYLKDNNGSGEFIQPTLVLMMTSSLFSLHIHSFSLADLFRVMYQIDNLRGRQTSEPNLGSVRA